jgi:nucleoside-diphosphate-sugar epimerase
MRVVVTGASGFVGSALVPALLAKGHQVTAVLRRAPDRSTGACVEIGELGVRLPRRVFSGAHLAFHLAHDMTGASLKKNVGGTQLWFAQAEGAGLAQVLLSSYSAHPQSPSDYGRSKYELERYFLERGGMVVRPGLVVGSGGMFGRMVATARRFPVLPILGGEFDVFLTGLTDLVRLLVEWEVHPGAAAVNLFSPNPVRMRTLVFRIRRYFKVSGLVVSVPAALAPLALNLGSHLTPALARYRDSFLALKASQDYHYLSSYPALGISPHSLEEMLTESFPDPARVG